MLVGKNLCLIGGSGYVGSAIAKKAQKLGAQVTCISRRGAPITRQDWQQNINYVQADVTDPEKISQNLEKADAVINTVGTLIDTSFTQGKKPGDYGTYEHLNRDVAINIANKLESFKKYKKIVYLSSAAPPPFINRYITTKQEAEEHLLSLTHVKSTILRPGFIYSFQERWWSLIVRYECDAWNYLHTKLMENVPQNSVMKDVVEKFYVERSVLLKDVVNASLYSAVNKETDGLRLTNEDIEKYSEIFEKK
ncbi:NAD-dependent epimerase/dehydratase family protein (macronuclear) [Tetrahymena thermophila SB210]|uniref:NAD-dependent epimerase/dehydratase family protein n=1 Tax=Tetrahymena thermophila (strain SB210) TaxID=312017 RepID=I7MM85_TETTS|nr:NAD-dependent epimerase/dehydratase family protein [Tetrahymena thermophila SB210]EAS04357.1 NAD-dependent epimerase/dehydratase family protein [Tetrahymena thermophila SB210]|eukprot:XP_001024602.1 NAD-dependent epimerase/dehydratase family protein [Tetrahymena thermophila SB210]